MCSQIVRDCWDTHEGASFQRKISVCNEVLAEWGKEIIESFFKRI